MLDTVGKECLGIIGDVNAGTEATAVVLAICSLMEGCEYQVRGEVGYKNKETAQIFGSTVLLKGNVR